MTNTFLAGDVLTLNDHSGYILVRSAHLGVSDNRIRFECRDSNGCSADFVSEMLDAATLAVRNGAPVR